jgi:hypothetical protein
MPRLSGKWSIALLSVLFILSEVLSFLFARRDWRMATDIFSALSICSLLALLVGLVRVKGLFYVRIVLGLVLLLYVAFMCFQWIAFLTNAD